LDRMLKRGGAGGAGRRVRGRAPRCVAADRRPQRAIKSHRSSREPDRARPGRQCRQGGAVARDQPYPRSGRQPERAAHLQGRFGAASITLERFVFNSIFGLGGLFDVATQGGLPKQTGDFGQTLFVWGVPAGPYVVRPYYGPSTFRDSIGGAVDTIGDPLGWVVGYWLIGWPWSVGSAGVSATAHLGQWKQAENASIDFYTFLRSDFYQTRRADLREALGLPPGVQSPATPGPVAGSPAAVRPVVQAPGYEIPPPQ